MISPKKLGLLLLAACAACAEAQGNDDNDLYPGFPGTSEAGVQGIVEAGLPSLDAGANPLPTTPDATTTLPTPVAEAGAPNRQDSGSQPVVDAGGTTVKDAAASEGGSTPTPTTM
jgi:hypothetical protein